MMRGFEAELASGGGVRAKRNVPQPKDDLSWSEVGEMAYGYLRIPIALIVVEVIYWWATDTGNTFEPYQAGIATIWASLSNLLWEGSAEVIRHDSGALTQVNLYNDLFYQGLVPVYVSDECVGLHEIVFLSVLMFLTPGVSNRTRWRSIAAMTLVVQMLNFIRLVVLCPLAVSGCEANPNSFGCEAPMVEFHNFILSSGFLAILVFIWLGWFYALQRKGMIDTMVKPSFKDFEELKGIRIREHLPNASKIIIGIALLISVWATATVTIDDGNQELKLSASSCEWDDDEGWINDDGVKCHLEMKRWEDIQGRAMRVWIFSAIFIGMAIVTTDEHSSTEEE